MAFEDLEVVVNFLRNPANVCPEASKEDLDIIKTVLSYSGRTSTSAGSSSGGASKPQPRHPGDASFGRGTPLPLRRDRDGLFASEELSARPGLKLILPPRPSRPELSAKAPRGRGRGRPTTSSNEEWRKIAQDLAGLQF